MAPALVGSGWGLAVRERKPRRSEARMPLEAAVAAQPEQRPRSSTQAGQDPMPDPGPISPVVPNLPAVLASRAAC